MTVSAPVPPVMVSAFETVTLLVPAARVSVSAPAPRSMAPPAWAAPKVILSICEPPVRVSTFETVSVLAPAEESVSVSVPAPRLMVPAAIAVVTVTESSRLPPVMVSILIAVSVLLPSDDSDQGVGAGGEVDAAGPDRAERDGIRAGAAGDGLDVGDRDAVGAVGQLQRIGRRPTRSMIPPVDRRAERDRVVLACRR